MRISVPYGSGFITLDVTFLRMRSATLLADHGKVSFGPQALPCTIFTLILEGRNIISGQGWHEVLDSGMGLLLPKDEVFSALFPKKKRLRVLDMQFQISGVRWDRVFQILPRTLTHSDESTALRKHMEACEREQARGNMALAQIECLSVILELAKIQARRHVKAFSRTVQKALALIHQKKAEPISRNLIAQACDVSASHLSKIIKAQTGITLTQHIARARVEQAKELMNVTNMNFSQIAEAMNMDLFSFSRLFKKTTGISPTAYCKAAEFNNIQYVERRSEKS